MLQKFLIRLENITLWIGCAALLAMGSIVTVSVVGRAAFNAPFPDDLLIAGLLMVCVIILPLSYVERKNGHIAVTVIAGLFPLRLQHFLAGIGRILFGLFLGVMGYMLLMKAPSEYSQGHYYDGTFEVPTWPMKLVFAFGVLIFLLRLSVNIWNNFQVVIGKAPLSKVEGDEDAIHE